MRDSHSSSAFSSWDPDEFDPSPNTSAHGLLITESSGQVVFSDERAETLLSMEAGVCTGRDLFSLLPTITEGNENKSVASLLKNLEEKSDNRHLTETLQDGDENRFLNVFLKPAEFGNETYLIVELSKRPDLAQIEQKALKNRRRLSLALNAARAGVWDWNLKTDEEYWDQNTEKLFGLEPGTFGGTRFLIEFG